MMMVCDSFLINFVWKYTYLLFQASLAFRGYLLWFINLSLSIYLFTQTFKVYDYNKLKDVGGNLNGVVNNGFKSDNELQGHSIFHNQPIKAYETE